MVLISHFRQMPIRTRPLSPVPSQRIIIIIIIRHCTTTRYVIWGVDSIVRRSTRICIRVLIFSFTTTKKWASFPRQWNVIWNHKRHDTEKSSVTSLYSRRPNTEVSRLGFLLNGLWTDILGANPFSFKYRREDSRIICITVSHRTGCFIENVLVFVYRPYIGFEHIPW